MDHTVRFWKCKIGLTHFHSFVSASSQQEQQQNGMHHLDTNVLAAMMMSEPLDEWKDADIASVIRYLRGSKGLNVPNDLREALGMNK